MARRVVLHVGLMKSGTSYLQERLFANQDLLTDLGVLLPGARWRDQVTAVVDVLERDHVGRRPDGAWQGLVEQVGACDGTAVVSMEFLGPARPESIARVLESFAPTPIHVVVSVRDLGRGVPAMWQETLQNGGTLTWGQYVGALAAGRGKPSKSFWRQQAAAKIVETWGEATGLDQISVVTVPGPAEPPGLLWERFCEAAGLDGSTCLQVSPANSSLDAGSALLLRDLNVRLRATDLTRGDYHSVVKFGLAKRELAGRVGPSIGFDPPTWLRTRSTRLTERLRDCGVRVIGELSDLEPVSVPGVDPDDFAPTTAAQRAAEVDVLLGETLQRVSARRDQATTTSEIV